jgi:hypothetical protein
VCVLYEWVSASPGRPLVMAVKQVDGLVIEGLRGHDKFLQPPEVTTPNQSSVPLQLDDWFGVMRGHSVMDEQEIQEGAEHIPLGDPRFDDQHGGGIVAFPHHLG